MNKREFEKIAEIIRKSAEHYRSNAAHAKAAQQAARILADTNPRFDAKRFISACMPREHIGTKHENSWERVA